MLKKLMTLILIGVGLSLTNATWSESVMLPARTQSITYHVAYAPNSPLKTVPLKNATLVMKRFLAGNPRGYLMVVTDQQQNFTLDATRDSMRVIRVYKILEENKYNARCQGLTEAGKTLLAVVCVSVK